MLPRAGFTIVPFSSCGMEDMFEVGAKRGVDCLSKPLVSITFLTCADLV